MDPENNRSIIGNPDEGRKILERWGIDIHSFPKFSEKEKTITVGVLNDYDPSFALEFRPTQEQRRQLICVMSAISGFGGCRDAQCVESGIAWGKGGSARQLRFYPWEVQFEVEDWGPLVGEDTRELPEGHCRAHGKYGLKLHEFIIVFHVMLEAGFNILGYRGFDYDFKTHTFLGMSPRDTVFRRIHHDAEQAKIFKRNFQDE